MKYPLIAIAITLVGCNGDDSSQGTCSPTSALETAISELTLPTAPADGGFDIDGDGKVDNAMAGVIGALSIAGLDSQGAVDDAITSGKIPLLIEVDGNDAAFANDSCVELTFGLGKALPTIKLDGSDHITIDTSVKTVTIGGEIASSVFTSAKPGGKPNPIPMLIGFANATVNVPINAVHITFTVDAIAGKLTGGKLGGAILDTDVQKVLLPGIGAQLTAEVAAGAQDSATIEQMFDNGGVAATGCNKTCKEPSTGVCAVANDKRIDGCEIDGNSVLNALLQPDVSIINSSGQIAPDHTRKTKDGVSLGFTFEAVTATY